VNNNFFTPTSVSITAGETVVWTWSAGATTHTVTFDDGQNSGEKSSGTYSRTFAGAGTFPYHCLIHGTSMSGTVTVAAQGGSAGGGGSGGGGGGGGGGGYGGYD
jgi:plastocyanin